MSDGAFSNFISFAGPSISILLQAATGFVLFYAGKAIRKWSAKIGINITDDEWAVVSRTAEKQAGLWWAESESSIATAVITPSNNKALTLAVDALTEIPQIAAKYGITPDVMAAFIVSALGNKQQQVASKPSTSISVEHK